MTSRLLAPGLAVQSESVLSEGASSLSSVMVDKRISVSGQVVKCRCGAACWLKCVGENYGKVHFTYDCTKVTDINGRN